MRCSACGQARKDYSEPMLDAAPDQRVCIKCQVAAGTFVPDTSQKMRFGRHTDNVVIVKQGDDSGEVDFSTSSGTLGSFAVPPESPRGSLVSPRKELTGKIGEA